MIPKKIRKEVCERDLLDASLHCKYCGAAMDFRGFEFAHREHRKMGGDKSKNTIENIIYIPAICHDRIDGRVDLKDRDKVLDWRIQHGCENALEIHIKHFEWYCTKDFLCKEYDKNKIQEICFKCEYCFKKF